MSKEIKKLRENNWNLRKLLWKRKEVSVENFRPCSDDLVKMMDFAVNNNILKKDSVLYTFMLDAVNQLNLAHSGNSPTKPKGMRWDTLTIKLAVALAVKCKRKATRQLESGYHYLPGDLFKGTVWPI